MTKLPITAPPGDLDIQYAAALHEEAGATLLYADFHIRIA
jgi:hypothetical protein